MSFSTILMAGVGLFFILAACAFSAAGAIADERVRSSKYPAGVMRRANMIIWGAIALALVGYLLTLFAR